METLSLKDAAEVFYQFLVGLTQPILVCHVIDWVTLLNNLALVGYDQKLVQVLEGVLDILQVVSNDKN